MSSHNTARTRAAQAGWPGGLTSYQVGEVIAAEVIQTCNAFLPSPLAPHAVARVRQRARLAAAKFSFSPFSRQQAVRCAAARAVIGKHFGAEVRSVRFIVHALPAGDTAWHDETCLEFPPTCVRLHHAATIQLSALVAEFGNVAQALQAILTVAEISREIVVEGQRHQDVFHNLLSVAAACVEHYRPEIDAFVAATEAHYDTGAKAPAVNTILHNSRVMLFRQRPSPQSLRLVDDIMASIAEIIA